MTPPSPSHTLAVDLGSTNFKAALFDGGGARVAEASRPLPYVVRINTRAELDPAAVTECFLACVHEALHVASQPATALRRVAFTSQAQTFCICDQDGNPLSPFLSWTDTRAGEEAAFFQRELGAVYHAHTGWPAVSASHTLAMARWWKIHHGLRPTDRVVLLPSFLAMQLGAPHASDRNIAPMSGFYSIPQGAWWDQALAAAEISAEQLGAVVGLGEPIATRQETRPEEFSNALEIVFAGNDHTAGAFGSVCTAQCPVLTLGTAGVLYRLAGNAFGPFHANGLWGPYPGGGFYELQVIGHACSALDWADGFLFASVDSPRFAAHAARAQPTSQTLFFYPERWGSAAAWHGEGTVEEMAYAVLEGILFALLDVAGGSTYQPPQEMVVLGGGRRLDFWLQMAADIFCCPLQPGLSDGLAGAARLAGCPVPTAPPAPGSLRHPEPGRWDFYRQRFAAWKAASEMPEPKTR